MYALQVFSSPIFFHLNLIFKFFKLKILEGCTAWEIFIPDHDKSVPAVEANSKPELGPPGKSRFFFLWNTQEVSVVFFYYSHKKFVQL